MKKIFERIKNLLKNLPRKAAEKSFITFLILLFLILVFCGFLFYKYSFLAEKTTPEIFGKQLKIKEKEYGEVLEVWAEHQKRIEEIRTKTYPDLFR